MSGNREYERKTVQDGGGVCKDVVDEVKVCENL